MNLRETTRDIINLVEERTGFPVTVLEDPAMKTMAVVYTANRKTLPAPLIRYNPSSSQAPDYLICFQRGFILRLFANPPDARFKIGSVPGSNETVERPLSTRVATMGLDRQLVGTQLSVHLHGSTS